MIPYNSKLNLTSKQASTRMGKTRNHNLVSKHMDEEEETIYDCMPQDFTEVDDDWYHEVPDTCKHSNDIEHCVNKTEEQKVTQKESKQWSGNVVKGVPTLYQLALDALPPKTRMNISKLVLPDITRN